MRGDEALRHVLERAHHLRPEDLPGLVSEAAPLIGARDVAIWLVDYDQTHLMHFAGADTATRKPEAIDGTMPGRSFSVVQCQTDRARGSTWVPLLDGTDRLGVLELVGAGELTDGARRVYVTFAALVAELVTTRGFVGDAVEVVRRRVPMRIASEILWQQLPPLTFVTDRLTLTAILEPCYKVGGDAFDFAVNGDTAHFAVFDGMGHGLHASTLSALALGAYRFARRNGYGLTHIHRTIDEAVRGEYRHSFLTATLAELDRVTGEFRCVSAGHPGTLLLREGKLVKQLDSPTALPLGLGHLGAEPYVVTEWLQPGDRVLLYTDGMVEGRNADGEPFGVRRLTDLIVKTSAGGLPAPETMRQLVHAVLAYHDDGLEDDASALLVEWLGGEGATNIAPG